MEFGLYIIKLRVCGPSLHDHKAILYSEYACEDSFQHGPQSNCHHMINAVGSI